VDKIIGEQVNIFSKLGHPSANAVENTENQQKKLSFNNNDKVYFQKAKTKTSSKNLYKRAMSKISKVSKPNTHRELTRSSSSSAESDQQRNYSSGSMQVIETDSHRNNAEMEGGLNKLKHNLHKLNSDLLNGIDTPGMNRRKNRMPTEIKEDEHESQNSQESQTSKKSKHSHPSNISQQSKVSKKPSHMSIVSNKSNKSNQTRHSVDDVTKSIMKRKTSVKDVIDNYIQRNKSTEMTGEILRARTKQSRKAFKFENSSDSEVQKKIISKTELEIVTENTNNQAKPERIKEVSFKPQNNTAKYQLSQKNVDRKTVDLTKKRVSGVHPFSTDFTKNVNNLKRNSQQIQIKPRASLNPMFNRSKILSDIVDLDKNDPDFKTKRDRRRSNFQIMKEFNNNMDAVQRVDDFSSATDGYSIANSGGHKVKSFYKRKVDPENSDEMFNILQKKELMSNIFVKRGIAYNKLVNRMAKNILHQAKVEKINTAKSPFRKYAIARNIGVEEENGIKLKKNNGEEYKWTGVMTQASFILRTHNFKSQLVKEMKENFMEKIIFYVKDCSFVKFKELMDKRNVDIEYQDQDGNTLLNHAAQANSLKICKNLISYDANINTQNKLLNTPLHYALLNRNFALTNLLISRNANQLLKNSFGMNPWENYAASGCEYKPKNDDYKP